MATALHSAVRPSAPLVVPPRTRLADMRAEAERLTQHIALVQQHTAALVREEEQARADRDALLREVLKVEGILADVAYKIGGLPQSTRSLVIASDGFTYDSYDLEKYIVGCRAANLEPKSANDGLPLDDSYYPPNSTYREILQLLREALRAPVVLDRSPPHSLSTSVVAS